MSGTVQMSDYLVMLKSKGLLAHVSESELVKFKSGVAALTAKGTIKAAYTKVGGGLVLIVESASNAALTVELRKHFITDAEIIPLVPLDAFLDAHIDYRKTGKIAV
jgi:hypothetical protein